MAIFRFSKMAAAAILDFQNFKLLTVGSSRGSKCVILPNLVEIGQNTAEIWRFFDFSRWRPSAILDLLSYWTTHEGRFGGLYHCAKFGWNRYSSFDTMRVFDFASLA